MTFGDKFTEFRPRITNDFNLNLIEDKLRIGISHGEDYTLRFLKEQDDIQRIVSMTEGLEQIVPKTTSQLHALIEKGRALVAIHNVDGLIASYLGTELDSSVQGYLEVGTAITWPEHQRKGLNTTLNNIQYSLTYLKGLAPWGFTDEIYDSSGEIYATAQSQIIFQRMGLDMLPVAQLNNELRESLIEPCPEACPHKANGIEGYTCKCSAWVPASDAAKNIFKKTTKILNEQN